MVCAYYGVIMESDTTVRVAEQTPACSAQQSSAMRRESTMEKLYWTHGPFIYFLQGHVAPQASEKRYQSLRAPVGDSAGYVYCGVRGRITNCAEPATHSPRSTGLRQ